MYFDGTVNSVSNSIWKLRPYHKGAKRPEFQIHDLNFNNLTVVCVFRETDAFVFVILILKVFL